MGDVISATVGPTPHPPRGRPLRARLSNSEIDFPTYKTDTHRHTGGRIGPGQGWEESRVPGQHAYPGSGSGPHLIMGESIAWVMITSG